PSSVGRVVCPTLGRRLRAALARETGAGFSLRGTKSCLWVGAVVIHLAPQRQRREVFPDLHERYGPIGERRVVHADVAALAIPWQIAMTVPVEVQRPAVRASP